MNHELIRTIFKLSSTAEENINVECSLILNKFKETVIEIASLLDRQDNNSDYYCQCALSLPYLVSQEDAKYMFVEKRCLDMILHLCKEPLFCHEAILALNHIANHLSPLRPFTPLEVRDKLLPNFDNEKLSNSKIFVDGKIIFTNKEVLAEESEYFRYLFTSGMKESIELQITIEDVEYSTFYKAVEFMYTHTLHALTLDEGIRLLITADRFQIKNLTKFCEEFLTGLLNGETIHTIYDVSLSFHATDLQWHCYHWLLTNMETLSKTEDGMQLLQSFMHKESFDDAIREHFGDFV